MARAKKQKILQFVIYPALGLGVTAILSYVLIIRPLQVRNQKLQFEKAEASLDTLAAQIEQTIGKPDDTKKEKSCGRANLKSEEGPLTCSTSLYMIYKNYEANKASDLMHTVSVINNTPLRTGSGAAKGKNFIASSQQRGEQTFYQSFDGKSGLSCSLAYSYPASNREFSVNGENFEVGMICSNPSMAEFFPVED